MDPDVWNWDETPITLGRVRMLYEVSRMLTADAFDSLRTLAVAQEVTPAALAHHFLTERLDAELAARTRSA